MASQEITFSVVPRHIFNEFCHHTAEDGLPREYSWQARHRGRQTRVARWYDDFPDELTWRMRGSQIVPSKAGVPQPLPLQVLCARACARSGASWGRMISTLPPPVLDRFQKREWMMPCFACAVDDRELQLQSTVAEGQTGMLPQGITWDDVFFNFFYDFGNGPTDNLPFALESCHISYRGTSGEQSTPFSAYQLFNEQRPNVPQGQRGVHRLFQPKKVLDALRAFRRECFKRGVDVALDWPVESSACGSASDQRQPPPPIGVADVQFALHQNVEQRSGKELGVVVCKDKAELAAARKAKKVMIFLEKWLVQTAAPRVDRHQALLIVRFQ